MDLKDNYKEKILNRLLDLFENRKVFKTLDFSKNNIYIDYKDKLLAYYHKEKYRYLPYFSNELDILTRNKLIFIKYDKDEEIERIYLNLNNIDSCYEFVFRTNKVKLYNELILLVNKYLSNSNNKVVKSYLNDCLITLNNRVSYTDKFKNSEDLILILKGIKGIIEYSDLYIKLSLPKGTLELFGSDLEIVTLSAGGVIIGGLIYKLEFDI